MKKNSTEKMAESIKNNVKSAFFSLTQNKMKDNMQDSLGGRLQDDLQDNLQDGSEDVLQDSVHRLMPLTRPDRKDTSLTLRLHGSTIQRLKQAAADNRISLNEAAGQIFDAYLASVGK